MDNQPLNSTRTSPSSRKNKCAKVRLPKMSRLFEGINQSFRSKHDEAAKLHLNTYSLEQLEPRLLLSADPLAVLAADANVTLQVIEKAENEQYIQLINDVNSNVLGERKLSDIVANSVITVTGTSGDEALTVDQSFLDLGERQFVVQFDGAGGTDKVSTGDTVTESNWQISGDNSGGMGTNGIVEFLNIEELEATQNEDSHNVLSAINNSFNWQLTEKGVGVVSNLEDIPGSILKQSTSTTVNFSGFDTISGSGTDYLDYSQYVFGVDEDLEVSVNLEEETATGLNGVTGINTLLGSNYGDNFIGDSNNNLFIVDLGDTVDGKGGFDSVMYRESGTAGLDIKVTVDNAGSDFTLTSGEWNGVDTFTPNADIDKAITLVDVDLLAAEGGDGQNYFDFSAADVAVHLSGGAEADVLLGGLKDDILIGGLGNDMLNGGAGIDEVIAVRTDNLGLTGNSLWIGDSETDPLVETDTLLEIDSVYLNAYSDDGIGRTLDARGADNYHITLQGSEYVDTIYASDHGDTLIGLGGADMITAGTGVDTFQDSFAGRAHISLPASNYELDLSQGENEKWTLDIPVATTGTGYTLTIEDANGDNVTTDEISWDAKARDVSLAIEKALSLNFGQLIVVQDDTQWQIEFMGLYAGQLMAQNISSSLPSVVATITQQGNKIVDTLIGFDANDIISISGSASADNVDLTEFTGHSVVSTFGGSDVIKGAQGLNIIDAGDGSDIVYVRGDTDDQVIGGRGEDIVIADLSTTTTSEYNFDLDNHQLEVADVTLSKSAIISLDGFESSSLIGGALADTFNAVDFYGVSGSTSLNLLQGWEDLTEHTLRVTLDDVSQTILDIDVTTASTLDGLIELINEADDRETGALVASFDQSTGELTLAGLSNLSEPDENITSLLDALGLPKGSVVGSVLSGASLSLLGSIQLTHQKGNGGVDSFVGSFGSDIFDVDIDDVSVTANSVTGTTETVVAQSTASHTEMVLTNDALVWKDTVNVTETSLGLIGVTAAQLSADVGATVIDASGSSLDVTLDAASTNVSLLGSTGKNELRLDISNRTVAPDQVISITIDGTATSNDVVFYGGTELFNQDDFDWANITGADYSLVSESSGDLTIDDGATIVGQNIKLSAQNGTITVNANVSTDDLTGIAGSITFEARRIVVENGVLISAKGSTLANSGDITLTANDSRNEIAGLGFYNFDRMSASVTVKDATIQGKDIEITATAESNPESPINFGAGELDVSFINYEDMKNELLQQSLIFGYSSSNVNTRVSIAETAHLEGQDVKIEAKSIGRVTSSPISAAIAVAIGDLTTTAEVDFKGTILAQGNVSITSHNENYLNVSAEPLFGLQGGAGAVAVGLLESNSTVLVDHTGNIVAEGNLEVRSRTFDFSYVEALSDAGNEGKLAASVAVHIENGTTTATLAGNVLVKGNVIVDSAQKQGQIDGKWGTKAEGKVERVPSVIDKQKDKYKNKAANTYVAKKIPLAKRASTPGNRLTPTKFTAGIAVAYVDDVNKANSFIGSESGSSDIQVGGNLNQTASIDSRLITDVNSVSSSPSQLTQVLGSAGSSGAFKQVPFGGAVSVTVANLDNQAKVHMQGTTQVDVLDKITLDSKAENLTGVISTDTTLKYVKPALINPDAINTDYTINKNDLIRFDDSDYSWQQADESEEPDIGVFGAVYKYIGDDRTDMRFATTKFDDVTKWEFLGNQFTSIPSQLLGGESDIYLLDNSIKSTAAGAKVSLALNFSLLDSKQTADSRVKGSVLINQRNNLENSFDAGTEANVAAASLLSSTLQVGDRDVDVTANTVNKSVDWVGNKTSSSSSLPLIKKLNKAKGSSDSLNGVGASVSINNVTMNSHAVIENGATVYADKLNVETNNDLFGIGIGYASGSGNGTLGIAGLYMGYNFDSTSVAQIESGTTIDIASRLATPQAVERLSVVANNEVNLIAIAGASGSGGAIGVGGSAIVTDVTKVTQALIGTQGGGVTGTGSVSVNGDARVEANSDGIIISTAVSSAKATGKVTPSGQSEPPVANSSYGISISGAFMFNTVNSSTTSGIQNLASFNADKLSLLADERSGVYAFPIAFASASAQKFALAAAGIGLRNDATFIVSSGMSNVATVTLDELFVRALNSSTVITTSISAAMSGLAETSVGASSSIAIAGNVSINNVTSNVDAYLTDMASVLVSEKNVDGFAVDIEAKDESEIYAVALGVAYAGSGAVGVTYAENNINSNIDALISNTNLTATTGKIKHQANSNADIVSVAVGAAVSKETSPDFDTKIGVSVAAAVSMNLVRMNTRAKVENNSTITLPAHNLDESRLEVTANNDTDIVGVVVAASVGVQSNSENTVSLTGAGASVTNEVYGDTSAIIDGATVNQSNADPLTTKSTQAIGTFVKADATGDIFATVVSASVAFAGSNAGTGVSGSIGVALASNDIGGDPDNSNKANKVSALINNSNIDISGATSTRAESKQNISSVVVAASVAIAKSNSGTAGSLSGVGASTTNDVEVDVTSGVTASAPNKSVLADSLSIVALDTSKITSNVVGASVAGSYSSSGGAGALSIGVSLAENNVTTNVSALAHGVSIGSSNSRIGNINLLAKSDSTITATSVAASIAAGYSSTGSISVSGAGANAINTIQGSTSSKISSSSVHSNSAVGVTATNLSKSDATVAAVAAAGAGGSGGGAGLSIGAAVAENLIGTGTSDLLVNASIENSAVDTTSTVTVLADATMTIDAGVGAGSIAIAGGSGGGLAGSGSGVNTTNGIHASVNSFIDNSADSTKKIKANGLTITANSASNITAVAGAATIAAGFGSGGGISGTIGVALARNNVNSKNSAYIKNATVELSDSALDINSTTNNTISATSVAASLGIAVGSGGGISLSGAGADSNNEVRGATLAYLDGVNLVSANGVTADAMNTSTIDATVAAVAASGAGGSGGGAGLAIGAAVSANDVGLSSESLAVKSYITNSSINTVGALSLNAVGNLTIEAGVGAGGAAIAGGSGGGLAAAGSGVNTINKVYADVESYIDNVLDPSKAINAASISLTSSNTSKITATAGAASLGGSFGAGGGVSVTLGVALASNTIDTNTKSYIANADSVSVGSGAVVLDANTNNTIKATSVAASLAIAGGAGGGVSISGAGADSNNAIYGESAAYLDGVSITNAGSVDLDASNTSNITATVAAVAASGAGGAGGGAGLAIGASVSTNDIGRSNDRLAVKSYIKNSSINTVGALTLNTLGNMTITAGVGAGGAAISGGSGGGISGAGSGVNTINKVYADVASYIDNYLNSSKAISATSLTLSSSNTSTISATAGAASLGGAFGAGGGVSVTIGVSLARNTIDVDTKAYIANADAVSTGTGAVDLNATTQSTITATSVAASLALAGGAGGGVAIAGAGADANNVIKGVTAAYLEESSLTSAGVVDLDARNTSTVSATVAAVSASGSGGAGGGVGVSIGAAVSKNEIGSSSDKLSVLSYIKNSAINASGALRLNALANMTITAGVGAGGMAVAGGAGGGVAAAGSGVSTTNKIYGITSSYIDNSGASSKTVSASSVNITSNSSSTITATIGSASLGVAGGAGGGVSITVGISLANNTIDIDTSAYLKGLSSLNSTGALTLSATTQNDISATSIAATSSIAGGAGGGISISGAGASASNDIFGETQAYIETSQVDSASSVSATASDTSDIDATVVAVAVSGAGGAGGGIGVALGAAFAFNNIGSSSNRQAVRSFVKNSGITTTGAMNLSATGNMTINSEVGAGSAAVTGGAGGGISGAGAGVNTTNKVYNEVSSYINNSSTNTRTFDVGSLTLVSNNVSRITATAGAAALAAGFGAGGGIAGSIGVALARNTIDSNTYSYLNSIAQLDSGSVSLTANTNNTIRAKSIAASIAVSVGAGGGISLSGAGAESSNRVYGTTKTYIANSTLGSLNNKVGQVDIIAKNTSTINATIAAVSAAGAGGAGGGIGVSIGASLSINDIGSSSDRLKVASYIDNSNLYSDGKLTLDAHAKMTVNAGVGAGSAAVAGGAVGISASGAGVGVTNNIYADLDSYIEDSGNIHANGIMIKSFSESDIDATAGAASLSASFAPVGFTVSIAASEIENNVNINIDSDVRRSTLVSNGDFTMLAETLDDVYTKGVATSVALGIGLAGAGVIVDSRIVGNVNAGVTDSNITVNGFGSVKSLADSKQSTDSYGMAGGLIAAGVVLADLAAYINSTIDFNNVDYVGYDLLLSAYGTENNYANAVAGSGGVLAGAGVGATTRSTSNTKVNMSDSTEITLGEHGGTGSLDLKAEHVARFDANIVAASGGLLSGSGAKVDHFITSDVMINLGDDNHSDNLIINAKDIEADAINRAEKDQGGKIRAVAAGLASAAGADSRTIIDFETLVDVADNAKITVTSDLETDGIALNTLNDLNIQDSVVLNATGALAATGATVRIDDTQLLAQVRIGKAATIVSSGDIQISSRATSDIVGSVESDSSGAISVTVTVTDAEIRPENKVLFDNDALITAYGNMNISAGTDTDFNRDVHKVHTIVDTFAGSVIPVDDATSSAKLLQSNSITIRNGAHAQTARRMNLHAERFGFSDMNAVTKTVNWASALGGTADLGGDVSSGATGAVVNYGTLETGIRRVQSIEFNSLNDDGSVGDFTASDGVTFKARNTPVSSDLFEALEEAEEQLAIFNTGNLTDSNIVDFYKREITRIQDILTEKGLMERVEIVDESSGTTRVVFLPNRVITPVITVNNIHAEAGRVDVRAGVLDFKNFGSIITPQDVTVDIINHTTASLVVKKITIPKENGGTYLNGDPTEDRDDNTPVIRIINDVDISKAEAEMRLRFPDSDPDSSIVLTWPSITLSGEITNRGGKLEVKSLSGRFDAAGTVEVGKGDINIYADIDVNDQEIITKGTFIASLPPGSTYPVGGSEYTKWNDEIGSNGTSEATAAEQLSQLNRDMSGPNLYANNISIVAEYININGKIQSGKETFSLTIDAAMEDTIAGYKARGASGLIRLDVGSEDFSVFYDASNDQIVVGDMRVNGGYIELEGHILNTNNNSNIELLGGYAEIDVTNNTSLDVKILGLDASQRGKGTLIIRDKAKGTSANPKVTKYIKDKDGVRVESNFTQTVYNQGEYNEFVIETPSTVTSGNDNMVYSPKTGWRYNWTMGLEKATRQYTTSGTSSWLGIDAFAADPDTVTSWGPPETISGPALTGQGAYFIYDYDLRDTVYDYDYDKTVLSEKSSLVRKWSTSTWYGKKTYYAKFVKETRTLHEYSHTIKADYGIDINFTGKESGEVNITSLRGGDVIVQGNISNNKGTTTILTNADIYSTGNNSVGGETIVLSASSIGGAPLLNEDGSFDAATNALKTNLTNGAGGSIFARTHGGRINIVEIDGPLAVKDITSASNRDLSVDTGGTVFLSAVGGIEAAAGTSGVVRGGIININSEAHVGSASQALNIDGGIANKDHVAIKAISDVFIDEIDGDLRLKSLNSSAGDVTITIGAGSLIDANTTAIRDERTYQELSNGLWDSLGLIEGSTAAQDKIDDVLDAYTASRQREYAAYWNIRNEQFDGNYDSNDIATISVGEEAYYREYYTQLGEEEGKSGAELTTYVDNSVQTLNNKRNTEYHALNAKYGGEAYQEDYEYTLSPEEMADLTASVHTWTEKELLNLISGSLLKPITDTQATIEDENIDVAGNITIFAAHNVGSTEGSVEIALDGEYTDEERVQLAAAERNDVYFSFEERVDAVVTVVDNAAGDQLINVGGDWIADGFVAGMQIRIAGDSANANDEGSFYEIASVNATTMTLVSTDLTVEENVEMDIAAISSRPQSETFINLSGQNWQDLGLAEKSVIESGGEFYIIQRIAGQVIDVDKTSSSKVTTSTIIATTEYRKGKLVDVIIDQREDVDVAALDSVNVTANGNLYLGSNSTVNVAQVSGDNVRIKSKQSLVDVSGSDAAVSAQSSLILEAGQGAIGTSTERFTIDLADGASLTARALNSIFITEADSDINVATIYSRTGTVDLLAGAGSIVDTLDHSYENIRAKDIVLTALSGSIGEAGDYLDINLTGGTIIANARDNIGLNETELAMNVDHIESTQGDVDLQAHMGILDAVDDSIGEVADVIGASINLISRFDTVGAIADDLEIDTGSQVGQNLTVSSAQNSHIIESVGDLYLNQVAAGAAAIAFIAAPSGRILNDNAGGDNVVSGMTYLFASQDIGEADNELTTSVGNIQGQSTAGDTYIVNTGALSVGGVVSGIAHGLLAGGAVHVTAHSPITITQDVLSTDEIEFSSADDLGVDDIVVASGVSLISTANSVVINSGDGFVLSAGAVIDAALDVDIQIDRGERDDPLDFSNLDIGVGAQAEVHGQMLAGNNITINGGDDDDIVQLTGDLRAQTININTKSGEDTILIDVERIDGDVTVKGGDDNDTITVNELHTRSDQMLLDGESGTDRYTINRTGDNAGYVIDVADSGSETSGADTLTINGTATQDSFLLRANFVAAMHSNGSGGFGNTVERINYDRNINARLTINGHAGADSFYSDDTSTITTLDGGAGADRFQVGQLFGTDRQSSLGVVALGDEIETTETTLGFLSRGNSLPMVIYGGDGNDNIQVYSNKAITKLYGEDGDDTFVVRAFLLQGSSLTNNSVDVELFGGNGADTIEYSINSALKIDGGAGTDSVIVLGTEGDDNFMVTEDGIFGAGLNVGFHGVEIAEVDGLEGDDTFYILSTSEKVETTIIGGLGADTFNVASDVVQPIVSYSVEGRSSFVNHSVLSDDDAYNGIFVNGVSLNVASQSNGAVTVDTGGTMLVDEDGLTDQYELGIGVPDANVAAGTVAYVTVSAARASSSDEEKTANEAASILISVDNVNFYESLVLTYTQGLDWNQSNTIYVKAIDDSGAEGQRQYVINHSVRSDNPDFDDLDINNVEVTVNDNDQADIILVNNGSSVLAEGGSSESFDVRLSTRPDVGETVTVSVDEVVLTGGSSQLTFVGPSTLEFTHDNWDDLQQFTLIATDDGDIENVFRAGILLSATNSQSGTSYSNVSNVEMDILVVDNDKGAVVVTPSNGSTLVTETSTDDYSLVLSKKPTAPVTVSLLNDGQTLFSSSDARFNATDNTVTFGTDDGDWDKPIVMTLSVNPDYQTLDANQPVQNPPLQPHTLNNIRGDVIIEGGVPAGKERTVEVAVMLPTESDSELPIININTNESLMTDTLNVFNDGSVENDSGLLTDTTVTGLGIREGKSITYRDVEVVEVLMGSGNDEFTVADTAQGAITVIHGGGGDDSINVTGSNSDGALILLGDTVQNGSTYNATSLLKTDKGREYTQAGNDTLNASGANGSVVLFGGLGDDLITGSNQGDHIAGGSGNDQIFGLGGDDHIYGDAGFNLDISTRLDLSTQVLEVVLNADSANDNLDTSDGLTVGSDTIDGGLGNDIILGDKGEISLIAGTNRILDTSIELVTTISNTAHLFGEIDTILGNDGNDIILAGFGGDVVFANAGDDTVIGDHGQVNLVNGIRSVVFSTDITNATGGDDVISLGSGEDQSIAGVGNDTVTNDSGESIIIGDDGRIESDASGRYVRALTGNTSIGGNDNVTGGSDRDIIFGGFGADRLDGQAGNDLIGGDGTQVTRNPDTIVLEAIDLFVGGDDTILGGAGFDRMQGHFGSDLFFANFNEDVLIGEYGRFTFDSNDINQSATYIISLAQGKLDLIRQLQTGLFSGFAKQVFFESNLGQAARSRTAVTTVFTDSAQTAVAGLSTAFQATSSGGGQGADFVIPTEPTAAGNVNETPVQDPAQEIPEDQVPTEGDVAPDEVILEEEQVEPEECEVMAEDGSCVSQPEEEPKAKGQIETDNQSNEVQIAESEGIDIKAALAAVGGWALMKDNTTNNKDRKKRKVA